ncbi:hypothetical protein ACIRPP_30925 [Streptomyces sp. NPDC101219]|uniref:hypothetical protein n=1 Tax=Streptomyces sp. NPDC101219 TaxID=3366131 RepID=UPI003811757F
MRRARTIIAIAAAAGLLAACGGSGDDDKKPAADQGAAASSAPAAGGQDKEKDDEKGTDGGDRADKTYEVTLEVGGSGSTSVYYVLGTNRTEQVSLPWKKSDSITLNSTQRKVGTIVSVVPGPVTQSDGRLAAAPCSITVDGKKVVDDPGGAEGNHICQYTLH